MKNATRLLNIGVVLTGAIWFMGCGFFSSIGGKQDTLATEVDTQAVEIEQLRATADTLTKTRSRMMDDLNNLMELNKLSTEEVDVLDEQANPDRKNLLTKMGQTIKKLWPF